MPLFRRMGTARRYLRRSVARRSRRALTRRRPRGGFSSRLLATSMNPALAPSPAYPFLAMKLRNTLYPASKFMEFEYADYYVINSLTTVNLFGAESKYRLGSCYDPDVNNVGTNHQPYLWDQSTPGFASYRVHSVRFRIEFSHPATTTMLAGVMITATPDPDVLASQLPWKLREKPGSWVDTIKSDGTVTVIQGAFNIWDIDGLSYNEWCGNSTYCSLTNTNPTATPLLHVAASDEAAPTSVSAVRVRMQIWFRTKMYNRVNQDYS